MLEVTLVSILTDNYAYVLQSGDDVAVVDPGDAAPIIEALEENPLLPNFIFNTHHHNDHIAGNKEIKEKYSAKLVAAEKDKHRISDIDQSVQDGNILQFGDEIVEVMETPGHTSGHICYWLPKSAVLFSGDTLFAMGCGRTFEGTAEQLFNAFQRFKELPDQTKIYCGHEYTQDNGIFCLSVDPDNQHLVERMEEVRVLRQNNQPTIPTTIELEKKTNIFMRAKNAIEFQKYRELKDQF